MKAVPRDLGAVLGGFLVFCGAQLSKRNLCGARFVFRGLHLRVLFMILLNAVDEQLLQPLLNSSVNPALHPLLASATPFC